MDVTDVNQVYEPYQVSSIYFKHLVGFCGNIIVLLESIQIGMKAKK